MMSHDLPVLSELSAFVLAGGRSSRMGTDKALLHLARKSLIQYAVDKLRHLTANVQILTFNPDLAPYAPLIPDIHPNTGPIGGLEAALTHSSTDWNLFLPVDMPFLPAAFLRAWLAQALTQQNTRIHLICTEDGRPQPGLCLLHRELLPALSQSISRGEYKLMHAFQSSSAEISINPLDRVTPMSLTPQQRASRHLWFTNLNTPQDFAEAEAHCDALDPL